MKKQVIAFNLFADHKRMEAGIEVEVALPIFEGEEAEKEMEEVKEMINALGAKLSDMFGKYRPKRDHEKCEEEKDPIDEIKELGRLAELIAEFTKTLDK